MWILIPSLIDATGRQEGRQHLDRQQRQQEAGMSAQQQLDLTKSVFGELPDGGGSIRRFDLGNGVMTVSLLE